MTTSYIGFDPALYHPCAALVDKDRTLLVSLDLEKTGDWQQDLANSIWQCHAMGEYLYSEASSDQVVVCAEGQQHYMRAGGEKELIALSALSGAFAAAAASCQELIVVPQPREWKGNVPKHVCQGRLYDYLGIEYATAGSAPKATRTGKSTKDRRYAVPVNLPSSVFVQGKVLKSRWADLGDAWAMAYWAAQWDRTGQRKPLRL